MGLASAHSTLVREHARGGRRLGWMGPRRVGSAKKYEWASTGQTSVQPCCTSKRWELLGLRGPRFCREWFEALCMVGEWVGPRSGPAEKGTSLDSGGQGLKHWFGEKENKPRFWRARGEESGLCTGKAT
eukprot:310733-Chlamydomonas_euryale.AAC.1